MDAPVHDALLVRVRERARELCDERERVGGGSVFQAPSWLREIRAVDQLFDDIVADPVAPDVEEPRDVLVREADRSARARLERGDVLGMVGEAGRQQREAHRRPEEDVPRRVRRPEGARRELGDQLVLVGDDSAHAPALYTRPRGAGKPRLTAVPSGDVPCRRT